MFIMWKLPSSCLFDQKVTLLIQMFVSNHAKRNLYILTQVKTDIEVKDVKLLLFFFTIENSLCVCHIAMLYKQTLTLESINHN